MKSGRKIRILYTIPNFDTAGSGKVVYDLVKGLDREKFDVHIVCNHDKGSFFAQVEALGVPIHLIQFTTPYRPYFSLLFRLYPIVSFFRRLDFDIIHSWHWSSDWTEPLAARLAGAKWLYTKKSMGWGNVHWHIRSHLANYIVTINDEMRIFFPRRRNQRIIPIGLDTEYYSPNNFSDANASDLFQIVTVANLVPVKGIETLIKAISLLANPMIRLRVVGDTQDPYSNELIELCTQLNLMETVEFMGKKPDVRPYLVSSQLFVIPTLDKGRKEGMPMALVEAMCMAIPVLGSSISGIKYVLKDFPDLLFTPGNEVELSDRIEMIRKMTASGRAQLGIHLRNYCVENFGMEKFIEQHELLYESMLS